ncbi:MAG TPA: hypothetical protein VJP76_08650 [Candidatus Tumulicola sp.]|nr:hypothetical protein [Candidatus Tumulicola sp.]
MLTNAVLAVSVFAFLFSLYVEVKATILEWNAYDTARRQLAILKISGFILGALLSLSLAISSTIELNAQGSSVRNATYAVTKATALIHRLQIKTAILQRKTSELSLEWKRALADAGTTSLQAARIMAEVDRLNHDTLSKLSKTERTAEQAAKEAAVYRIPDGVSARIAQVLSNESAGRASVACAPGLQAACGDLARLFKAAKWQVRSTLGASFYGGGVFDAPSSNNGPTGIYVWYGTGRERLAQQLADALSGIGVHAETKVEPKSFQPTPDISINIVFVTK